MKNVLATMMIASAMTLACASIADAQRASTDEEIKKALGFAPKAPPKEAAPLAPVPGTPVAFPSFDVEALCEKMARRSASDLTYDPKADRSYRTTETSSTAFEGTPERVVKSIRNHCVEQEQAPYARTKGVWSSVAPDEQTKCVAGAKQSSPYIYTYLNACVTGALARAAQRNPGTTKFRY